jgi:hypothetical protein
VQDLIEANPNYVNDLDLRLDFTYKTFPVRWKRQVSKMLSKPSLFVNTGIKQGGLSVYFYDA